MRRYFTLGLLGLALAAPAARAAAPPADRAALAVRAQAVLKAHCYRCHGQDGAVEGGINYILDTEKLISRRKVAPGDSAKSRLYRLVAGGKMPPASVKARPGAADLEALRRWIDAGAPGARPAGARALVTDAQVFEVILADLDTLDRRARRFARYFSLAPLANAGAGPDELRTYSNALAKLLNSLSWHPRVTLPKAVDKAGLVLRIDLRDYLLDANLWNRVLTDYPYGVAHDTGVARAVLVATATRMPVVRADWFVATASRAPLYYDLLQIPSNLSDLERQLRVDVDANLRQERVARAGFLGSGVSKNNRILERHDAMNGAYWRTYDFEAVPQNLFERNVLLPDRRNIFAYPLGPGSAETQFQHAGGEVIFNLPNGLHAFVLVNANNVRVDKGPTAIVSDPRRPDRAVEAGVSCMHCHSVGILQKDDQIRAHVAKSKKAFTRADAELVAALYPPAAAMRKLMQEDADRFRKALEKTGNKVTSAEVVMAMTLRHEADVDLATLAAELGLRPKDVLPKLTATDGLARNLGALKVAGATVSRQVVAQAFADLVRELRLGSVFQPGTTGEALPDATGEADPLEAQSSPANATAFSADGKTAAFASADRSVRIFDVEGDRDLRRCVGHTASVWCVAFSPDGTKLLSGGKDGTVRLWDVETARELLKLEGHADLVSAVAFSPDGKRALSTGYDHEAILWDLKKGERVAAFSFADVAKYLHAVAFAPDGKRALVAGGKTLYLLDAGTGKVLRRLDGHTAWVAHAVFSPDGTRVLSGGDDGTARLWDAESGKELKTFTGHVGYVKAAVFSGDGKQVLTGGGDATVRLWDADTAKELKAFTKHAEPLVAVAFLKGGRFTVSGSRDAVVHYWRVPGPAPKPAPVKPDPVKPPPAPTKAEALKPAATVRVDGSVGALLLSPDRSALYYLNLTEGSVGRVDAKALRRDALLRLAEGTDALALSPDGKLLVATARLKKGRLTSRTSTVQVIDPGKLSLSKSFLLTESAYDLAVADSGLLYVSGADGEWTDVTVADVHKGAAVANWGGVWAKSFVRLSADGRRLYHSSQGVLPGTFDALVLPAKPDDKPTTYRSPAYGKQPLGGEFVLSPDGRFVLLKNGTVLKASAEKEADLLFHAKLPPFLAAAIDGDGKSAYLIARDGALKRYSYPEFKWQADYALGLSGYQLAVDGKAGRLYVAGFDPRAVSDRPRARGHGDIHVYELKYLLGGTAARR